VPSTAASMGIIIVMMMLMRYMLSVVVACRTVS
jgi:hypothetical protein